MHKKFNQVKKVQKCVDVLLDSVCSSNIFHMVCVLQGLLSCEIKAEVFQTSGALKST